MKFQKIERRKKENCVNFKRESDEFMPKYTREQAEKRKKNEKEGGGIRRKLVPFL